MSVSIWYLPPVTTQEPYMNDRAE